MSGEPLEKVLDLEGLGKYDSKIKALIANSGGEGGGTVPNLTLDTLTLGGRFTIQYNSLTDSLDFEVIENG